MSEIMEYAKSADGIFREYVPGSIITEPGAYLNMPMSVYHGQPTDGPSISSSQLRKIFNESPAHYWDESPLNPDRQPFQDTEFTILGRAAHHLLLGEANFRQHFAIRPDTAPDGSGDWHGRKKSCQLWLAEQQLEGLTVVTKAQIEQIKGIEKAMLREPAIQSGILGGMIEVSLFYKDHETGIWVKARPDSIPKDNDAADLKVVSDITDSGISKGLGDQGYHQQAAVSKAAFREVLRRELDMFFLVYAEGKRPHSIRIDAIAPDEIDQGMAENRAALHLFKRCLEENYWPGPKNQAGDGGFVHRTKYARELAEKRLKRIELDLGL